MFRNLRFISIFVFVFLVPLNVIANEKIYFVDIDYILFNSIAGKKISSHIQDESKKINLEFKKYKSQIDIIKRIPVWYIWIGCNRGNIAT